MDSNLTKVCPQCNSRAVCKCGYAFPSKRKAQSGNAMKCRSVHKASVRASETSPKTLPGSNNRLAATTTAVAQLPCYY